MTTECYIREFWNKGVNGLINSQSSTVSTSYITRLFMIHDDTRFTDVQEAFNIDKEPFELLSDMLTISAWLGIF